MQGDKDNWKLKPQSKCDHHFYDEDKNQLIDIHDSEVEPVKINRKIDFLNIDIEGVDHMVLASIDFKKFKPKVILFEDNENFGGSTGTISLLIKNGYKHFLYNY